MKCPRCRLENPPSALYCDCGYEFVEGSNPDLPKDVPDPLTESFARVTAKDWLWILGAGVFGAMTGYLGGDAYFNHTATGISNFAEAASFPSILMVLFATDLPRGGPPVMFLNFFLYALPAYVIFLFMRFASRH